MPQIGHFPKHPSIEASKQGGKVERRRLCPKKRPVSMSPAAESTLQCCTPILYSAVHFKHHYCCLHYMFFPLGGRLGGDTLSLAACWCFPGRAFDTMLPPLESISGHEESDLSLTLPCESSESSGHDFPIGILSL